MFNKTNIKKNLIFLKKKWIKDGVDIGKLKDEGKLTFLEEIAYEKFDKFKVLLWVLYCLIICF